MRYFIGCGIVIFLFTGCATQHETNTLIADSNVRRYESFAKSMVEAQTEGARIAIAMGFAGGLGQQEFHRERDGVDYLSALLPYITLALPFAYSGSGYAGGELSAGRDIYLESTNDRNGDGLDWFNTADQNSFRNTSGGEQCFSPSGTPIPCEGK